MTQHRVHQDQPPAALFLVYKFPDLDHLVPVVTRLATEGRSVQVVSLNPLLDPIDAGSLESADWRIRHLHQLEGVAYDSVYRLGPQTKLEAFTGWLLTRPLFRISFRRSAPVRGLETQLVQRLVKLLIIRVRGAVGSLGRRLIYLPLMNRVAPRIFDDIWARRLLDFVSSPALIVDHSVRYNLLVFGPLMRVARSRGMPIIALPHGLPLFSGHMEVFALAYKNLKEANFDSVVVAHDMLKDDLIARGVDPSIIQVLGSARYCREWFESLYEIIPYVPPFPEDQKKLRVVYMDRGRAWINKDLIREVLLAAADLDFIDLVYKPHPRSNNIHQSELPGRVTIATEADSINLVRWADVVIGSVSSVLIEVLLADKTLIYPTFFDDEKMLLDEFGACWRVDDVDELLFALRTLHGGRTERPYGREALKHFEEVVILGGQADRDVLGGYVDLILGLGGQQESSVREKAVSDTSSSSPGPGLANSIT